MPGAHIIREVGVTRTPRVMQVEGIFDVPPSQRSREEWQIHLPLEEQAWHIGLIVGPSGSGKSTIARELWGAAVCQGFVWPTDDSVLDGFPREMSIKEITELLSSVGFSSPPLWLRPFHVLSTGQQMRVNVARLLAEQRELAVMDEFTSVVDRTVAQIGAAAIAKTVRRRQQRFIAVTCHYDVEEWLQPDWVYQPHSNEFRWKSPGRRPAIALEVRRVHRVAWQLFRPYHYLNHSLNKTARCFVAFLRDGTPVALLAILSSPHPRCKKLYRVHRVVCLPDYQGVGIGNALITYVASAYLGLENRMLTTTASPSLINSWRKSEKWRCSRAPHLARPRGASSGQKSWLPAVNRLTSTWEYVGPAMSGDEARRFVYDESDDH